MGLISLALYLQSGITVMGIIIDENSYSSDK